MIVTKEIDNAQVTSVREAGYNYDRREFVTQDTTKCPFSMLIIVLIKRVNFERKYNYELFVGTNKTVHYTCIWVSAWWDSTINTLHNNYYFNTWSSLS